MGDLKISELEAASTLTGTELLAGVQSGINKRITPNQIRNLVGRTYNVEAYGAVHDGQKVYNGAITSGTAILTSASNPFVSGDVGKIIVVSGAGAAGVALKTTILSYQNAGQVTLSVNASATPTNAHVTWGTDDTVAIQAANDACFAAGGGKVYFPKGIYIIDGALQTSVDGVNPNCQLYLKAHQTITAPYGLISVEWEGETRFPQISYSDPDMSGVVLLSTLITSSGTRPAVIGTKGLTGGYLDFNMDEFIMKNISILTHSNKGQTRVLSGLNGEYLATFTIDKCVFSIDSDVLTSASPSAFEHFGAWLSNVNNNGPNELRLSDAGGYKYGFIIGEHTDITLSYAIANINGFVFLNGNYAVTGYILGHQNTNHILIPDATFGGYTAGSVFLNLTAELEGVIPALWYSTTTQIIDSGNLGRGIIRGLNSGAQGFTAWLPRTGAQVLNLVPFGSVLGIQSAQSGLGPTSSSGVTLGSNNSPLLELGNDIATSTDTNFASLWLGARQSGTANTLGQFAFINTVIAGADKRLGIISGATNAATNSVIMYVSAMLAGVLTTVMHWTGTHTKFYLPVVIDNDISPTALAANTDNYAPTGIATAATLRISASSAVDLTGIAGGATMVDGRELTLINVGTTNTITLKTDVTSTAANRFLLNADFALAANMAVKLVYDGTSSRWRKTY